MASQQLVDTYPLLDVYRAALTDLLAGSVVPRQLAEDMLPHIQTLLFTIVECLDGLARQPDYIEQKGRTHNIRQVFSIVNLLSLSVKTHALLRPNMAGLDEVLAAIRDLSRWAAATRNRVLTTMPAIAAGSHAHEADVGEQRETVFKPDEQVSTLAKDIVEDIRRHWVFSGGRITVPALRNAGVATSGQQSMQGTAEPSLDNETCARALFSEIESFREKYDWVREGESDEAFLDWRPRVPMPRSWGIEEFIFDN
jgi:hypothetical protein